MLLERTAVAKRQDLSDFIHYADFKNTPFISSVSKGTKPINTLVEWPVDNYPDPRTTGVIDGADIQDAEWENLGRPNAVLANRVQIWRRAPRVSTLSQVVMVQGGVAQRESYALSIAKGLIMIKRDMETTALGDSESQADTGAVPNRMRGLGKWISSTAQTDLPVDPAYLTPATSILTGTMSTFNPDGTINVQGTINDDTVTAVLQSIFDQTGDADMDLTGWCGSKMKRQLSLITKYETIDAPVVLARRFNNDIDTNTVTQKVDIIRTDFGNLNLRLSSFINTGGTPKTDASKSLCYITPMQKEMIRMRYSEAPFSRDLPDLGGGPRAEVRAIGTLEVGNPLCFGKIVGS